MRTLFATLGVVTLAALGIARAETAAAPVDGGPKADRTFTCIATDHSGVKRWEPATFIVYEGEKVHFKLFNRIPKATGVAVHGFAIPAFDVKVAVEADNKEPVLVDFTASKAGLFDINCHLHPAHVGGQLFVMKK